ncbi:sodium ion-translocating decarboxylase subunit beta, partial [Arthrospira platensis SPKY1]|nr:sodium ion-translocating decarboxylase subunit beta [Arthrospira platensis SPKY1]
ALHALFLPAQEQPAQDTLRPEVTLSEAPAPNGQGKALEALQTFFRYTGFANARPGNFVMIAIGLFFIWLAIKYHYEPLLLIPIGTGILLGNIPFHLEAGLQIGIYE